MGYLSFCAMKWWVDATCKCHRTCHRTGQTADLSSNAGWVQPSSEHAGAHAHAHAHAHASNQNAQQAACNPAPCNPLLRWRGGQARCQSHKEAAPPAEHNNTKQKFAMPLILLCTHPCTRHPLPAKSHTFTAQGWLWVESGSQNRKPSRSLRWPVAAQTATHTILAHFLSGMDACCTSTKHLWLPHVLL